MLIVRRRYSVTAFVGVRALGMGIHIGADVINAFGTMIFALFSMRRAPAMRKSAKGSDLISWRRHNFLRRKMWNI